MKIRGSKRIEVDINPKDVIQKLMSDALGEKGCFVHQGRNENGHYLKNQDNKEYYLYTESNGGRFKQDLPISKEKYHYIGALTIVLTYLNK